MQIKELSVGNYVKYNNDILKISEISHYGWLHFEHIAMTSDYILPFLQPVYIKDVIDKLGFEKVTDGGFEHYEIYSDEFMDITMEEYTDGLYFVHVFNNEYNFPTECKLLSSIHELQNFLTMCNAYLKIEL